MDELGVFVLDPTKPFSNWSLHSSLNTVSFVHGHSLPSLHLWILYYPWRWRGIRICTICRRWGYSTGIRRVIRAPVDLVGVVSITIRLQLPMASARLVRGSVIFHFSPSFCISLFFLLLSLYLASLCLDLCSLAIDWYHTTTERARERPQRWLASVEFP